MRKTWEADRLRDNPFYLLWHAFHAGVGYAKAWIDRSAAERAQLRTYAEALINAGYDWKTLDDFPRPGIPKELGELIIAFIDGKPPQAN